MHQTRGRWHRADRYGALLPLIPVLAWAWAGCGQAPLDNPLAASDAFVSIPYTPSEATLAARRQSLSAALVPLATEAGREDFYLAIHRSELGQRYFLATYLKQFFPGAVQLGAAQSLGTLVVTFKVQNGKLYIYNVGDGKASSDTFTPELLVDAYPIVSYPPFERLAGAENYLLVDPAAGLNRFAVVGDAFAGGGAPDRFSVELGYLQRFRRVQDGITFEYVFSGYGELPSDVSSDLGEPNAFRASGTLGMALRRYRETPEYTPSNIPLQPYYFISEPRLIPNTGQLTAEPNKWAIYPGMKPIRWLISDKFVEVQQFFPEYDILGAIKAGVENWNEVFGFKALEAVIAQPGDSFADDDLNYLIFDYDPTFGAAFANWRENPNTGEIRGATVYYNSIWLLIADAIFDDDPVQPRLTAPLPPLSLGRSPRPRVPGLVWEAAKSRRLCTLWAPTFRPGDPPAVQPASLRATLGRPSLTKAEKVRRYLTHIALHEIGHTLGLRHNFRGSTEPPSSSVMEYIDDFDAIYADKPLPYDYQAIRHLYGLSPTPPTYPFCTDEDTSRQVDCTAFDRTRDPLNQFVGPAYRDVVSDYLEGRSPVRPNVTLNDVLKYVRAAPSDTQRLGGFVWAVDLLRVGAADTQAGASPGYGERVDELAQILFRRLYLDGPALRGEFTADPPASDTTLHNLIVAELRGNLLNLDGLRSFPTRRVCVDALKRMQTIAAYRVLKEARDTLAAELADGMITDLDTLSYTEDLLVRITNAVSPYFN